MNKLRVKYLSRKMRCSTRLSRDANITVKMSIYRTRIIRVYARIVNGHCIVNAKIPALADDAVLARPSRVNQQGG